MANFTSYDPGGPYYLSCVEPCAFRPDLEIYGPRRISSVLESKRETNKSFASRFCTELRLEGILHIQLDNALVWSLRLPVHHTPAVGVIVSRDGFRVVVDDIAQGKRVQVLVTRQWVVQPVERFRAELYLLVLMDPEAPRDSKIIIEVRCG